MSIESRLSKLEIVAVRQTKDDRAKRVSDILCRVTSNEATERDVAEFDWLMENWDQECNALT